jgi:quercetin dioxygenase-like cupin family protein
MLVRNRDEVEPVTYSGDSQGVEMRPLITQAEGAPRFAMRVFTLEPAGHTPYHAHAWEHEVYVLAGSGSVNSHDGKRTISVGDSIYIAPFEEHQLHAGPDGLQFICCAPHH